MKKGVMKEERKKPGKKPKKLVQDLHGSLLKLKTISLKKESYEKYYPHFKNEDFVIEINKIVEKFYYSSQYKNCVTPEDKIHYFEKSVAKINFLSFIASAAPRLEYHYFWLYKLMEELIQDFCNLSVFIFLLERAPEKYPGLLDLLEDYKKVLDSFKPEFKDFLSKIAKKEPLVVSQENTGIIKLYAEIPRVLFNLYRNFIRIEINYLYKKRADRDLAAARNAYERVNEAFEELNRNIGNILAIEGLKGAPAIQNVKEKSASMEETRREIAKIKNILDKDGLESLIVGAPKIGVFDQKIELVSKSDIEEMAHQFFQEVKELPPSENNFRYEKIAKKYHKVAEDFFVRSIFVDEISKKIKEKIKSRIKAIDADEYIKKKIKDVSIPIVNILHFTSFYLLPDAQLDELLSVFWLHLTDIYTGSVSIYVKNNMQPEELTGCYNDIVFCDTYIKKYLANGSWRIIFEIPSHVSFNYLNVDFFDVHIALCQVQVSRALFLMFNNRFEEAKKELDNLPADFDALKLKLPEIKAHSSYEDKEIDFCIEKIEIEISDAQKKIIELEEMSFKPLCYEYLSKLKKADLSLSVTFAQSTSLDEGRYEIHQRQISKILDNIEAFTRDRKKNDYLNLLPSELERTLSCLKSITGYPVSFYDILIEKGVTLCEKWIGYFEHDEATIYEKWLAVFFDEQAQHLRMFLPMKKKELSDKKALTSTLVENKKESIGKEEKVRLPYLGKKKKGESTRIIKSKTKMAKRKTIRKKKQQEKKQEEKILDITEKMGDLSLEPSPKEKLAPEGTVLPFKIALDSSISEIMCKLRKIAPVYIKGGFVRDTLRGRTPKDVDIIINCTKKAINELFPYARDRWNTTHTNLFKLEHNLDIYLTSSESLKDEAQTCDIDDNALFCDEEGTIFDPLNVYDTLNIPWLHLIGDHQKRLTKDSSLLLRLVRFKHELHKEIPEDYLDEAYIRKLSTIPWGVHISNMKSLFMGNPHDAFLNMRDMISYGMMSYLYSEQPVVINPFMQEYWHHVLHKFYYMYPDKKDNKKNIYQIMALFLLPRLVEKIGKKELDAAIEIVIEEMSKKFKLSISIDPRSGKCFDPELHLKEHLREHYYDYLKGNPYPYIDLGTTLFSKEMHFLQSLDNILKSDPLFFFKAIDYALFFKKEFAEEHKKAMSSYCLLECFSWETYIHNVTELFLKEEGYAHRALSFITNNDLLATFVSTDPEVNAVLKSSDSSKITSFWHRQLNEKITAQDLIALFLLPKLLNGKKQAKKEEVIQSIMDDFSRLSKCTEETIQYIEGKLIQYEKEYEISCFRKPNKKEITITPLYQLKRDEERKGNKKEKEEDKKVDRKTKKRKNNLHFV